MRIKQLTTILSCIGVALGLISCKEEKRIVGSWEVVKTQTTETIKNHPIAERNITRDTTEFPEAGESTILTFTKKGVVLAQETDSKGNIDSYSESYMIIDNKLYVGNMEWTMSIKGKEMILTSENTRTEYHYEPGSYDTNGNWVPGKETKYQVYEKEIITLKER